MCGIYCSGFNCKECNNDLDVCTKCEDTFYVANGKCLACTTNCKLCTDATFGTCSECDVGYFLDTT
jgi:hypothetical protein